MTNQKSHLGFLIGFVFQMVSMIIFYFLGLSFSGIGIMLLGALISIIGLSETRKAKPLHAFGAILTIVGLALTIVFSIVGVISSLAIIMVLAYAVGFFAFAYLFPPIRRIPRKLPVTSKDKAGKIKVGEEADKIFKEIEKLEAEVKKESAKQKGAVSKQKSTAKKTSKRTTKKRATKKQAEKYAAVKGGKTFHQLSCSILLRQDSKKYVYFKTRQKALSSGRRPCRVCNP